MPLGGLPVPTVQLRVAVPGQTYRGDLGYEDQRVLIEFDGRENHERWEDVGLRSGPPERPDERGMDRPALHVGASDVQARGCVADDSGSVDERHARLNGESTMTFNGETTQFRK